MPSDIEQLNALKVKYEKVSNLLDTLYVEFEQEEATHLGFGLWEIKEHAGVINAKERAILDEMQARATWISDAILKLGLKIDPLQIKHFDKGAKQQVAEHDSDEYIDLQDKNLIAKFKQELNLKINNTGNRVDQLHSSMAESSASNKLDLNTCLDITQKIIGTVKPEISAAIGLVRFIGSVIGKTYSSFHKSGAVDAKQYVYDLAKSMIEFKSDDEAYHLFVKDYKKIKKIKDSDATSLVNSADFLAFQKSFIDSYMNSKDVINRLFQYLAKHQDENQDDMIPIIGIPAPNPFPTDDLANSTGTVVVTYDYDYDKKTFLFDEGYIDDVGSDFKKALLREKKEDSVLDLPLKIKLFINPSSIMGKPIQAIRESETPGNIGFNLTFYGSETTEKATEIVALFVKAKILEELKVPSVL